MVVLVPWSVYPDKRKMEGGVAVFVVVRLGGFYEEEGITKRRRAAAPGSFLTTLRLNSEHFVQCFVPLLLN